MTVLVTGSSGHLGEALMRTLRASGRAALGLDTDRGLYRRHQSIATASWSPQPAGVDAVVMFDAHDAAAPCAWKLYQTRVHGALICSEAVRAPRPAFHTPSTTSTFGDAKPRRSRQPDPRRRAVEEH